MTKLTVTKLIEHAERAYREYGDIQIAIRMNHTHIVPVVQVGVAGLDPLNRSVDDTYLCLAANKFDEIEPQQQELPST
jgi:hypothetical protein